MTPRRPVPLSPGNVTRLLLATLAGAACASTTAPLPPPAELLLVVNTDEATLSILTLPSLTTQARLQLLTATTRLASVTANRRFALVPTGTRGLVVVDGPGRRVTRTLSFPEAAVLTEAVFLDDSVAFVTDAGRNLLVRVNAASGDTASLDLPGHPNDVVLARGRLFVLSGNAAPCNNRNALCTMGPSWITVVNPGTFSQTNPGDSIPLPGEGAARFIESGGDGFLYVVSAGSEDSTDGRLAIVDPVRRVEVGNFGGFGSIPGRFAVDGTERILIASQVDGLMEFNIRSRSVTRGAGAGIPIDRSASVAVDSRRRILAVESGTCDGRIPGRLRVFRPDLTEVQFVLLGQCAGSVAVAFIPPLPED